MQNIGKIFLTLTVLISLSLAEDDYLKSGYLKILEHNKGVTIEKDNKNKTKEVRTEPLLKIAKPTSKSKAVGFIEGDYAKVIILKQNNKYKLKVIEIKD
jgi:hypothetical protein